MGYEGYSIVGDRELSDFWKEQMRKGAQKEALKEQIKEELEFKKQLFELYLNHGYAIRSIALNHRTLSDNIESAFEGKAKRALRDRFDENIRQAFFMNTNFDYFIKHFERK